MLRFGPAHVPSQIAGRDKGFTGTQTTRAANRLGVIRHKLDGEDYWVRPANVFAIWWGNRPVHYYERQQREGGIVARRSTSKLVLSSSNREDAPASCGALVRNHDDKEAKEAA